MLQGNSLLIQKAAYRLIRMLLVFSLVAVPALCFADTTAPYSKPFHKQGRGWYPSIYWSTGRNLGSYYLPNTDGALYHELAEDEWKKDTHGLVIFYRPDSQWASEELEAPSYYINDELVFNLRAGSYTYVELPAGSYDFTVRKSLLPLIGFEALDDKLMVAIDLNLQADMGLEIDPGDIFYIRHSEVSLPSRLHPELDPEDEMATADVQLVDREMAMTEIGETRYLNYSFWHPSDAAKAEELLSGEMQEYGWFTVIWPWSNNFLFGFPFFYLPSDMYRELRGDVPLTLEEELYLLADDKEAYLEAIADKREVKRNWLAPWRKPATGLTLNDELLLDRLERNAIAGKIEPVEREEVVIEEKEDDGRSWYWPFGDDQEEEQMTEEVVVQARHIDETRQANIDRIKQLLN